MGSKGLVRSRWAAIGAAVAVTLGGGGLIGVSAASGDGSSLKTTTPTRILDTRGDDKVSGETFVLQVTGEVATYTSAGEVNATVVPAGANAVAVNLTVTEGVRNQGYGFVTAFPCTAASDAVPSASTLNFVEGVDVANSTVVPLGATGKMCLNVYGSAHLIVDVSGYYDEGLADQVSANSAAIALLETAEATNLTNTQVWKSVAPSALYEISDTNDACDPKNYYSNVYYVQIDIGNDTPCAYGANVEPPELSVDLLNTHTWVPTGMMLCFEGQPGGIDGYQFGRITYGTITGSKASSLNSSEAASWLPGLAVGFGWADGALADDFEGCMSYLNADGVNDVDNAYSGGQTWNSTTMADWEGLRNFWLDFGFQEENGDEPSRLSIRGIEILWNLIEY